MRVSAMLGAALVLSVAVTNGAQAAEPVHAHASTVIVIIMENRDSVSVIGDKDAPFINDTLVPQSALMTGSHAVAHPSEPNYLALFSGSTQGVVDDSCPHSFSVPNLGAEIIAAGKTFAGYSESMPSDGFAGCRTSLYARKHNPWVNFTDVPASSNLVWHGLPDKQPAVSFIVPNMCDDMHDCSTKTGDDWLKANLPAILKYDAAHDGLAILTWDEAEPDTSGKNTIPTLLVGPMIVPGKYTQKIDHYAVLHTIEEIAGVACTASACGAPVLTSIWR